MPDAVRYEEALSQGHSHSWEQEWDQAIKAFEEALAEYPEKPAPYAGLGMAYFSLNQYVKALENYKLAARYSRGEVIYLRQVAEMQQRLGEDEQAAQTLMAIGEVMLRKGDVEEAVQAWRRAALLDPELLGAHQRLARYYSSQRQLVPAVQEYLVVARIYQNRGEDDKAALACQTALKLDPRSVELLTALDMIQQGEPLAEHPELFEPLESLVGELTSSEETAAAEEDEADEGASPIQDARRMALEQLAEDVFEGEAIGEDEEVELGGLARGERDALISQALDHQTRGNVNEAIGCYEQAIAAGMTRAAAHFNLGLLYQEKLRFEDAIREFSIAVKDQEYRLASEFALGECYRARGQIDKALEHFITVLKIVDLSTVERDQVDRLIELYEHLADSLITKGEPERATAFTDALEGFLSHRGWEDKVKEARMRLDSLSGDRIMILGDILTAGSEEVLESLYLTREYEKRGMVSTAIEEVYRAIATSPDYLPAHIRLAELLVASGQIETAVGKYVVVGDTFRVRGDMNGAINMYERVMDISSLDLSIRSRLVDLLKRHGQIDRSLEHYIALGEAYYQLAQLDKARETYQDALKLAPRGTAEKRWRPRLLRLIADIDMQRFDWRRALLAYRELRDEEPQDERIAITLIDLYLKLGQEPMALKELDEYLKQLVSSGRGAKVFGILEDMVQRYPASVGLTDRLVRLLLMQKRREAAVAALDRLGEAQLEAGQTEQAAMTIGRIIQLNPDNVGSYRQLLKQLEPPA